MLELTASIVGHEQYDLFFGILFDIFNQLWMTTAVIMEIVE